jgi:cytochrome P450
MYAALREHDPVHRVVPNGNPSADYWVLSRHEDVWEAARDVETFSSASGLTTQYDELDKIGLRDNPPFVMQDPPTHTDFRRTVSRGFTPRQVTSVEPAVRAFVVDRLDRLADAGEVDIVAELFKPLPTMVVAHYLGVPPEDRDRFDAWTHDIVAASSAGSPLEAAEAVGELMTYFTELAERRRHEPEDDTISHLVAAGAAEDTDGLLSILGFAFTMVTGGNDTTTGMLGGAVQLLNNRPDQREILVADPALIPDAVEELLRLTSPVQGLARTTTRDVEIDGTTIPMGRKVLLLYGSANRDTLKYGPDAEELDVARSPSQILTFSHGNHHCLGAAAARMQARVALEELLVRFPHFEVDIDGVEYAPGPYVRRPTRVPFRAGTP